MEGRYPLPATRMRSTSGQHYLALDHVRAVAAWFVFVWHFNHGNPGATAPLPPTFAVPISPAGLLQNAMTAWQLFVQHFAPGALAGTPVLFRNTPSFWPGSLLDEGHTGVALFMTLSGYLFAKLLDGRRVHFGAFLWNRALRLLPLLAVVLTIVGVETVVNGSASLLDYLRFVGSGLLLPHLPNGAWSITVELHFYVLLPLLLAMSRRWTWPLLVVVASMIALRAVIHATDGSVQMLAYSTLCGRMDQFVFGILALRHRAAIARRWPLVLAALAAFVFAYHDFDASGGYYGDSGYPTTTAWWIILPTIEGLAYALAIAAYDTLARPRDTGVSAFLARLGAWSYSIYLLHFFVVFHLAALFTDWFGIRAMSFTVSTGLATVCFCAMAPIGWLSFRIIEGPFLKLRRPYLK